MTKALGFLALCCGLGIAAEQESFAVSVFPGETWQTRTPEQVGMSAAALDEISKPGDGVIVRYGYLVYSWGNPSSGGDWASATKTLISTMLGIAIQEGKCSMDTLASEFEPLLTGKDAEITFRHLATMTSGYGLAERPGQAWAYNDVAIMLYHNIVYNKIYKQDPRVAIQSKIVSYLHFEDPWSVPKRIRASVRDMARFGLLYLRWGNWNGTQLVDESFVREAIRNQVPSGLPRTSGKSAPATAGDATYGGGKDQSAVGPGHYGYNWWTNENGLCPDVPRDVYQANGHWGNETVTVIPSYDLVIACRGNIGGWAQMNVFLAEVIASVEDPKSLGYLGSFPKWSKVELVLHGPESAGLGTSNPFRTKVDVTFSGPGERAYTVPAFYDGDGKGGMDGNVWKARFSPDATGIWNFESNIKLSALNGYRGTFRVTQPAKDTPKLFQRGRLEYVGEHYLKFRDGGYWFKAGADDPENFLGAAFGKDDWANKKSEVTYLARKGINSMYVMTHTLEGDGRDVWPWYGATDSEAKAHSDRFDVAKLAKWEDAFLHMQNEGIVIHLVLEDDSAWTGYDHALYYREMVARFGYLPALYFNMCEEYNERYTLAEALANAATLRALDPYHHPIGIHNVNSPTAAYLNNPSIEMTSIQGYKDGDAVAAFDAAVNWRRQSEAAGKKLVVSFDEYMNYPAENTPEARAIARRTAWGAALGGGIVEAYTSPFESFADYEDFWDDLRHLREFIEGLPFPQMTPDPAFRGASRGVCFSLPGYVYAVYLPDGGSSTLDLSGVEGKFSVRWYNPREGIFKEGKVSEVSGGEVVSLGVAPFREDAACLVKKKGLQIKDIRRAAPTSLEILWPASENEWYWLEKSDSLTTGEWWAAPREYLLVGDTAVRRIAVPEEERGFFRVAILVQ